MKALYKIIQTRSPLFRRVLSRTVIIVSFALVGAGLLISSHAATPTASFQVESGTRSGNVGVVADSSASGGSGVKFGAATTSGNCISGALNDPGTADPWGGCWPGPQNTGYPHGVLGDTRTPVTLSKIVPDTVSSGTGWHWEYYDNSNHAAGGYINIDSCSATTPIVFDSYLLKGGLWLQGGKGNGYHTPDHPCVKVMNSKMMGISYSDSINDGPVVIQDSEIDSDGDLGAFENAGRYNFFTYRVNSHGGQGVLKCAAYCETKDNWVHGMTLGGQPGYHYNAIGGNGMEAGSWIIDHNWASCGDWESIDPNVGSDAGCSAVIGFYGDFDPIRNITVNRNHLESTYDISANGINRQAGYCINPGYYGGKPYPNPTNMTITDNIFGKGLSGKCGVFGPANSLNKVGQGGTNVWSGNRYDDGTVIPRVEE